MNSTTLLDEAILDARVTFRVRPIPVPCTLRPVFRIAVLSLLMSHCHGDQATLLQLHVLNWAIRNTENRRRFLAYLAGEIRPDDVVVRFDPTLSRAVDFALAEGLLSIPDRDPSQSDVPQRMPVMLTAKGKDFVATLNGKDFSDVLVTEKTFLRSLGRKLTQTQIDSLFPKE